jgi:large subunit ribosomal protein L19
VNSEAVSKEENQKKSYHICLSSKNFVSLHPLYVISGGKCVARYIAFRYVEQLKSYKTMDLIKVAEEAFASIKEYPAFKSGDTITVSYRIREGNKERIQQYRGVVIRISGHGDKKRFTVRKMSENVGVERIFPMDSPFIETIALNKSGKVRRAKLYYLRKLTGKKARIKEKRV